MKRSGVSTVRLALHVSNKIPLALESNTVSCRWVSLETTEGGPFLLDGTLNSRCDNRILRPNMLHKLGRYMLLHDGEKSGLPG